MKRSNVKQSSTDLATTKEQKALAAAKKLFRIEASSLAELNEKLQELRASPMATHDDQRAIDAFRRKHAVQH